MRGNGGGDVAGRRSSLLGQLEQSERERGLEASLRGRELPDVELTAVQVSRVMPLRGYVGGLSIIYFVPGEHGGRAWVDGCATRDAAQHRGYIKRVEEFKRLHTSVLGIASQPPLELAAIATWLCATHPLFSDPDMKVGGALGLSRCCGEQDSRRYSRSVLVARDGVIIKVFHAVSDRDAANSARQVLAWLSATGRAD